MIEPTSTATAEHYLWGDGCDGWHLLKRGDFSVIQERVPAGKSEIMHYHNTARQFFFILDGVGTMAYEGRGVTLQKGDGMEIAPGVRHQFCNHSGADVQFLVISVPPSHGDRVDL